MQNDYRSYYSEDTLMVRTNNFKDAPEINNLKTDIQFYEGSEVTRPDLKKIILKVPC